MRILMLLGIVFFAALQSASAADYRFGKLTNVDCRPSALYPGCQIDASGFSNPAIFLMPTIDQSALDKDLPATLRVLGRWGSTFYVVQDTAPESVNHSYKSNPMSEVQYLIVEKGKIVEFEGGAFYAQTVNSNKQIHSGYTYDVDDHNYPWHVFPNRFDDQDNVVITELQSATYGYSYKPTYWLTSDPVHIEDDGFHSGLERTELSYVYNNKYSLVESLAYLVGYGEGYLDGDNYISFSTGNSYQPMGWNDYYVEESCKHEIDLGTVFDSEPYLFTRSQWRLGSVGGWTRHCKGSNDSVSVVIEDMLWSDTLRKNNYQPTGTLAYGVKSKISPPDQCTFVKSAVQTWSNLAFLTASPTNAIETPNHQLGFFGQGQIINGATCSDNGVASACKAEATLTIAEPQWQTFPSGTHPSPRRENGLLVLSPGIYEGLPPLSGATGYRFEPGVYWFRSFELSGSERLHFENNPNNLPEFKTLINVQDLLSLQGNTDINHEGDPDNLIFKVHGINSSVTMSAKDKIRALILARFAVTLSGEVEITGSISTVYLTMSGRAKVFGQSDCFSPTPPSLQLVITPTTGSGIACDGIPIDFSLVDSATGNIVDGSGQSLFVDASPVSGSNYACWSSDGNMPTSQCKSDHDYNASFPIGAPATVRGYIHSKFINDYNITAFVNSEGLSKSAGPYTFLAQSVSIVPSNGVDGNEFYQVAGREFPFRLKVRGTQGNGNQLNCKVIDVDGSVDVDFSFLQLPSSSPNPLLISHNSGTWKNANTTLPITFKDGVAGGTETAADGSLKLRLDDAGIVDFTGSGTSGNQSITSTERFYFRPFVQTFCDQNGSLPNNTTQTNGGFQAAGRDVDVYLKAFNWSLNFDSNNDGVPNNGLLASNICPSLTQTDSYYTHNGYPALVELEQLPLVYPTGGNLGNLMLDGTMFNGQSIELSESNRYLARVLSWDEVGTLSVLGRQNNYLSQSGFDIPSVPAHIGRFYPARFNIESSPWSAVDNQGNITYLDQSYQSAGVNIEAFAFSSDEDNVEPLSNYHLFAPSLLADFELQQDDVIPNVLTFDITSGLWGAGINGQSVWSVTDNNALLQRNYVSATPLTSEENGPFNTGDLNSVETEFSLRVTSTSDPVSFDQQSVVDEQDLPTQPPARYGRMVLDSVGGTTATAIPIPLRIEFWDGDAFVQNPEDSASLLATADNHVCKQVLWSDNPGTSDSALVGSDSVPWENVATGASNAVSATPDSSGTREQLQFWMRLGLNRPDGVDTGCTSTLSQPWLQYDWRNLGDEDPSTVVTFGIYRGNDRVIFRGEPGLTGQ
ncbi:DUF6701 domain-containing protein [Vibrio hepatarius]|uniref:DUF6701 domain-containing protein n=1 Tax=Vibrio hepatarius TaxID=171383 RepID=UPI003734F05D